MRSFCSGTMRAKTLTEPIRPASSSSVIASSSGPVIAPSTVVEPDLAGDRQCGARVVAGDHDGAHAGAAALGDRSRDAGAHRDRADRRGRGYSKSKSCCSGGSPFGQAEVGPRHAEDALAVLGRSLDLRGECGEPLGVEVAQVGDRLRSALRGDDVLGRRQGERHTCESASRCSESGYSRTRSSRECRCSVSTR